MSKLNYGFKEPVKDEQDKRLGSFNSLPKITRNPSGNWYLSLPKFEKQFGTGWDSFGCTVFGTLNAYETILKILTGIEHNFDERYNYNLINLEEPGADPKEAAQSVHKYGVTENKLPFVDNFTEFRSPRPMTDDMKEEGSRWLEKYNFAYEWVFDGEDDKTKRLALIKECLRYSPLGVSVDAWFQNEKGEYYSPENSRNNHWCLAFRVDEFNRVWVFDTYDASIKTLSPDHNIRFCMRYHIDTLEEAKTKISLLTKMVGLLNDLLNLFKKRQEIVEMEFIPAQKKTKL